MKQMDKNRARHRALLQSIERCLLGSVDNLGEGCRVLGGQLG